jgi:hypoxanthine-guanine phosphoribosyltransferase
MAVSNRAEWSELEKECHEQLLALAKQIQKSSGVSGRVVLSILAGEIVFIACRLGEVDERSAGLPRLDALQRVE